MKNIKPKAKHIEMAAQLWCLPKHENKVMDPDFAFSIAEMLAEFEYELTKKCECGGAKTSGTHSTWCPKYE